MTKPVLAGRHRGQAVAAAAEWVTVPIGLMAASNIVPIRIVNEFAKLILVASRSVNSLVWALLFVAIFGPGALAGTIAIAFRSIGFAGKLLAEAVEEASADPVEALTAAGASWPKVLIKGHWPRVQPAFWCIALFRWDSNVGESAILGLVGAGGDRTGAGFGDELLSVDAGRDHPHRHLYSRYPGRNPGESDSQAPHLISHPK